MARVATPNATLALNAMIVKTRALTTVPIVISV